MFVVNAEKTFDKSDLFYCYSPKLKRFLCKVKNIDYIGKGLNNQNNKEYWLFIKTSILSSALTEWTDNKENAIKAMP